MRQRSSSGTEPQTLQLCGMCLNLKASRAPQSNAVLSKVDPHAYDPLRIDPRLTLDGDIYFKSALIAERMLGLAAINLKA